MSGTDTSRPALGTNAIDPELLGTVFCELMETVALLCGEPIPKDDLDPDECGGIRLSIRFKGERSGYLAWFLHRQTGERIAGNVLGLDVEDTYNRLCASETLKELTRNLCGQVLEAVFGCERDYELSETDLERSTADEWQDVIDSAHGLCYRIDGEPVIVRFHAED